MKISEIFYSLQGEGFLAGRPSVFIRLAGCPLRCDWCDTKYAWSNERTLDLTIEQIIDLIKKYDSSSVVVTGGEPMVNPELSVLTRGLRRIYEHITIETAGIKFVPDLCCDLMSISPKLINSIPKDKSIAALHNENRLNIKALKQLMDSYEYQLKFVVDVPQDIKDIENLLDELPNIKKEKILLMPQSANRGDYIKKSQVVADMCKNTGFSFCQRLHVLLYDRQKGV